MALPAVTNICRHFGTDAVAVAVAQAMAPVFHGLPALDRVVPLQGGRDGIGPHADRLADGRFDVAILFPNSFRSAWVTRRAGIAERWGYRGQLRGWLLTRAVRRPSRVSAAIRPTTIERSCATRYFGRCGGRAPGRNAGPDSSRRGAARAPPGDGRHTARCGRAWSHERTREAMAARAVRRAGPPCGNRARPDGPAGRQPRRPRRRACSRSALTDFDFGFDFGSAPSQVASSTSSVDRSVGAHGRAVGL